MSEPLHDHKKGQIESAKVVIKDVFSNFWFCIPAYQRSYVWGKDEISELIDDVHYASEHSPVGQYFLGSMVLQKKYVQTKHRVSFELHDVLDGQQRLTTLLLMIAVIRDLAPDDEPGKKLRRLCGEMLFQEESIWDNTPGRDRLVYEIRDHVAGFIDRFVKPYGGTRRTAELEAEAKATNLSRANMAKGLCFIRD